MKATGTYTIKGFGLEGYLDGTSLAPTKLIPVVGNEPAKVNPKFVLWQRQDQLLASWLLSSLSEPILISVVGLNISYDIWKSIETNFSSHLKARLMQYKLQLQNLRKNNLSIREYLNKVKSCCDAIASAGERISEDNQIMHVLGGLGNEYDVVVVTVTSKLESYNLQEVTSLLLSYESRMEDAALVNMEGSTPSANLAMPGRGGNYWNPGRGNQGNGGRGNNRGGRNFGSKC
ncbi:hypothetical protein DH2020_047046 [Rehmannia glutinosa]|uniref:Uncharacterized protein n=1 Tax=Rehmannia glutinosa TaxID=99300 RepID=A0ABR0U9G0_REHGL